MHQGAGMLSTQGYVGQEQVELPDFLGNRFGKVYDQRLAAASSLA